MYISELSNKTGLIICIFTKAMDKAILSSPLSTSLFLLLSRLYRNPESVSEVFTSFTSSLTILVQLFILDCTSVFIITWVLLAVINSLLINNIVIRHTSNVCHHPIAINYACATLDIGLLGFYSALLWLWNLISPLHELKLHKRRRLLGFRLLTGYSV